MKRYRLRNTTQAKKRHIFLVNLKKILKHSLSVQDHSFYSGFGSEMLKTTKATFCSKLNKMVALFAIRKQGKKLIALRTICCID